MTAITAQDVNKLRQMTGVGMMDCKKALIEAEGDFEKAIDILRKKGQKVSASRAGREAGEGAIVVKTSADAKKGVVLSLNCETDFVAKNAEFVAFANKVAEVALTEMPADATELGAKSIEGRSIADHITDLIGKIGEKIEIGGYATISAEGVVSYLHGGKIGVLVGLNQPINAEIETAGKDAAMQIAAMSPVAVDKDSVSAATLERELEIAREQVRAEGKPEDMVEKIAQGKLNKFFKESTLLNQDFVKDGSITVRQMLDKASKGLSVTEFRRLAVGN